MNGLLLFIYVCLTGSAGVGIRYALNFWETKVQNIIISTALINFFGSFAIGTIWELLQKKEISHETYIIICAGFLGGLTTFSGYTLNLALLTNYGGKQFQIVPFVLYGTLMPFVSVGATLLGMLISKLKN